MDSPRQVREEDVQLYSTAPQRCPSSNGKYRTLPQPDYETYKNIMDIPRRPHKEKEIFNTIPGRFAARGPMKMAPMALPNSHLHKGPILQDSTNWSSSVTYGAKGSKTVKLDKSLYTGVRDERESEDVNRAIRQNAKEQERKRRRTHREPQTDTRGPSSVHKQRQKGSHARNEAVYGEWEPYYMFEQRKVARWDDPNSSNYQPKVLLAQLDSQMPKQMLLRSFEPQYNKVKPEGKPVRDKKKWWFSSEKPLKPGKSDLLTTLKQQEEISNIYREGSFHTTNTNYISPFPNENQVKRNERKPPPYVPPPSYNSSHHIIPGSNKINICTNFDGKPFLNEVALVACMERGQPEVNKIPQYNAEPLVNSKLTLSKKAGSQGAANRNKCDPQIYQNKKWDKKFPPAIRTRGWVNPQWQENKHCPKTSECIDHIYDSVEGEGCAFTTTMNYCQDSYLPFPLHMPKMTHERPIIPQQTSVSKPSKKLFTDKKAVTNGTKRNKLTQNQEHWHAGPFLSCPPIASFDMKFRDPNYKFQHSSKIEKYPVESDDGYGSKGRRPLKESRSNFASVTNKNTYDQYSYSLPWKQDRSDCINIVTEDKYYPIYSSKKKIYDEYTTQPKWREPGKIRTLPVISNDHNIRRQHKDLKQRDKCRQLIDQLSEESHGLFLIDATCVVVRAEYVFPPKLERVKFMSETQSLQEDRNPSHSDGAKETDPLLSHGKPVFGNTLDIHPSKGRTVPTLDQSIPPKREIVNIQERATRILGLSTSEFNNAQGHLERKDMSQWAPENVAHTVWTKECEAVDKCYKITEMKDELCSHTEVSKNSSAFCPLLESNSNQDLLYIHPVKNEQKLGSEQNAMDCYKENTNIAGNDIKSLFSNTQNGEIHVKPRTTEDNCYNTPAVLEKGGQDLKVIKDEIPVITKPSFKEKPTGVNAHFGKVILTSQRDIDKQSTQRVCPVSECPKDDNENSKRTGSSEQGLTAIRGRAEYCLGVTEQMSDRLQTSHKLKPAHLLEPRGQSKLQTLKINDVHSTRRPTRVSLSNYFAKDLREAVSRIRRHTAPDSDTDEDIDGPSSCSSPVEYGKDVKQTVMSCSSDSSDSEVTVILCGNGKEEKVIPRSGEVSPRNDSPKSSSRETLCIMNNVSEEALQDDAILKKPINPINPNGCKVEERLDLNSCIEEILQDLNRTEEEFFSPANDSAVAGQTDIIVHPANEE